MNTKRLLKLAEFLETEVSESCFDTQSSIYIKPGGWASTNAVGWATQVPG